MNRIIVFRFLLRCLHRRQLSGCVGLFLVLSVNDVVFWFCVCVSHPRDAIVSTTLGIGWPLWGLDTSTALSLFQGKAR